MIIFIYTSFNPIHCSKASFATEIWTDDSQILKVEEQEPRWLNNNRFGITKAVDEQEMNKKKTEQFSPRPKRSAYFAPEPCYSYVVA